MKNKDKAITYRNILEISRQGVSDPIVYYIHRRIAAFIVYVLKNINSIKPNHITVLFFILEVLAAAFCFFGNFFVGGILMIIVDILDCVDGTLARVRGETSKFGAFIDGLLGDVGVTLVLFTIFLKINIFWGFIFFAIISIKNILKLYTRSNHILFVKEEKKIRLALSHGTIGYLLILAIFNSYIVIAIFLIYAVLSLLTNIVRTIKYMNSIRST